MSLLLKMLRLGLLVFHGTPPTSPMTTPSAVHPVLTGAFPDVLLCASAAL